MVFLPWCRAAFGDGKANHVHKKQCSRCLFMKGIRSQREVAMRHRTIVLAGAAAGLLLLALTRAPISDSRPAQAQTATQTPPGGQAGDNAAVVQQLTQLNTKTDQLVQGLTQLNT